MEKREPAGSEGPVRSGKPGFVERRRRPTPMLSRYSFFGGRRQGGRRGVEDEGQYVDTYEPRLAVLVALFFALTVFDAVATVYYIDHAQGQEFNPIARWMLERGRLFFVFAKCVPTSLLLLFVMIHKNFRYGRLALGVGFGFYLLLAVYHLVLQLMAYGQVLRGPIRG